MMSTITDEREVRVPPLGLAGTLAVPRACRAVVAFAHGSGSGRASAANRRVAEGLWSRALGTLRFDLLTEAEARRREWSFDIPLLAERLRLATRWLEQEDATRELPIGYFGESTGAAAALSAAARGGGSICAVVCGAGRPDLALSALGEVHAPTLLIVGSHDPVVLELNRKALTELRCENELVVLPGATHRFEEPGALDEVIRLAGRWFVDHLVTPREVPELLAQRAPAGPATSR